MIKFDEEKIKSRDAEKNAKTFSVLIIYYTTIFKNIDIKKLLHINNNYKSKAYPKESFTKIAHTRLKNITAMKFCNTNII